MPVGFQPPKSPPAPSRGASVTEFRESDSACIEIGLINNMPAAAVETTERQFRSLLDAASEGISVRLSRYALPEVPRSIEVRERISRVYSNIHELWNGQLDGVIVTGAEPLTANLADEPFWGSMTTLLEWAEHNTHSSIWSCLAAHAAVLHVDGIKRRPLQNKLSGVFDSTSVASNRLTAGLPPRLCMPHSRWNDVPETSLVGCGYRVLTRSEQAGVDAFVKQRKSLFVLFQGHPEYEADSLLLEYRRDIRRFLRGERDTYPRMPRHCFDPKDAALFMALGKAALSDRREGLLADFPGAPLAARVTNTWRPAAIRMYRNWLLHLSEQKARRLRGKRRQKEFGQPDAVTLGPVLANVGPQTFKAPGENPLE